MVYPNSDRSETRRNTVNLPADGRKWLIVEGQSEVVDCRMSDRKRIIIDCDPGIDDAIAIVLAAKLTRIEAITTVAGNVSLEHTTRNALAICELLDLDIPVCAGAQTSMTHEQPNAAHVHGENGLAEIHLPTNGRVADSQSAVECLLNQSDSEIWIVAIGPLTNLAHAIQVDSTWVNRVAGLCLMGGSTNGGNATAAAEFNVFGDYEAAKIVFESDLPIAMCGLNLTTQFRVSRMDLQLLESGTQPGKVVRFVNDILSFYLNRASELSFGTTASLHDPCAVLAVSHPELFTFRERPVYIETQGEFTRGMTVVDERSSRNPPSDSKHARVGYILESARLKKLLFDTLLSY